MVWPSLCVTDVLSVLDEYEITGDQFEIKRKVTNPAHKHTLTMSCPSFIVLACKSFMCVCVLIQVRATWTLSVHGNCLCKATDCTCEL